jgi:hypothetical protein
VGLVALCFCGISIFAVWWFARDFSGLQYLDRAFRLALRDPQSDAQIAIEQRDFRLIGVNGLGLHVPSMPGYRSYGPDHVRVIDGTSDFFQSSAEAWFNSVAWNYAQSYNQILINADVVPAELSLQQPVCVETGAAGVLKWGIAKPSPAGLMVPGQPVDPASLNWMVDGVGCVTAPQISTRKATCFENNVKVAVVSHIQCFQ